jgi:hypothetical protein
MEMKAGATIWIPCEVKPGPFSNERLAKLAVSGTEWVGFVDVRDLRETPESGPTFVRARVTAVAVDSFTAELPGHPLSASRQFHGLCSNASPLV